MAEDKNIAPPPSDVLTEDELKAIPSPESVLGEPEKKKETPATEPPLESSSEAGFVSTSDSEKTPELQWTTGENDQVELQTPTEEFQVTKTPDDLIDKKGAAEVEQFLLEELKTRETKKQMQRLEAAEQMGINPLPIQDEHALFIKNLEEGHELRIPTEGEWEDYVKTDEGKQVLKIQQGKWDEVERFWGNLGKIESEADQASLQRAKGGLSKFLYGFEVGDKAHETAKGDTQFIANNIEESPDKVIDYFENELRLALHRTGKNPEILSTEGIGTMMGGQYKPLLTALGTGVLGSILGTPLTGIAVGAAISATDAAITGFGAAFRQAYFEGRHQGMEPKTALDAAAKVGWYGAAGGAVEGGLGVITGLGPIGKFVTRAVAAPVMKTAIRGIADVSLDALAAAGSQIAQNKEAQKQNIKRGTFDGVKENVIAEIAFSGIMHIPAGVTTAIEARNYLNALPEDQQDLATDKIKEAKETQEKIPDTITGKQRTEAYELVKEKDALKQQDPALARGRVKEIDERLEELGGVKKKEAEPEVTKEEPVTEEAVQPVLKKYTEAKDERYGYIQEQGKEKRELTKEEFLAEEEKLQSVVKEEETEVIEEVTEPKLPEGETVTEEAPTTPTPTEVDAEVEEVAPTISDRVDPEMIADKSEESKKFIGDVMELGEKEPKTLSGIGMTSKEISQAIKNIKENKETAASKKFLETMDKFVEQGFAEVTTGKGIDLTPHQVPLDEFSGAKIEEAAEVPTTPIEGEVTEELQQEADIVLEEPTPDAETAAVEQSKEFVTKVEKVKKANVKQREDFKATQKPLFKKVRDAMVKGLFDVKGVVKRELLNAGAAEAVMRKDLVAGASSKAKKDFTKYRKKIFDDLSSSEELALNDYIQWRRVVDLDTQYDTQGKTRLKHPHGVTKEDAEAYFQDIKNTDPKLAAKLEEKADAYFEANRDLLTQKLAEGRITQDLYDKLIANDYSKRAFLHHMADSQESSGGIRQPSVSQNEIKALDEGSVESMFNNARWLLEQHVLSTNRNIFENRANRALHTFAEDNPDNGLVEIQKPRGANKETGQPIYPDPKTGFEQVQYFEDGVKKSLVMKSELAADWLNADPPMKQSWANAIRLGTGGAMLRFMATGTNPAFALSNFPRDLAHVLFVTDTYSPAFPVAVAQIASDLKDVAMDVIKRKGSYQSYIDEGGGMDFLTHQGRPLKTSASPQGTTARGFEAFQNAVGYINESSELFVRLATRNREIKTRNKAFAKKEGRNPNTQEQELINAESTGAARRQMDFSQGGEWVKFADNFIPYLNAAFQGSRVSLNYIKSNPATFGFKVAQLGGVVTAVTLHNLEYDEWDDIPDYEKAGNYIFMLPTTYTDDDGKTRRYYAKIPKAHEMAFWAGIFENLTEFVKTGKYPTKKSVKDIELMLPPANFKNIPIVDAAYTYETNFDRFRGQEVWRGRNVSPELEYTKRTPKFFKELGKATDMSPERLKAAMGKVTTDVTRNPWGVLISKSYDTVTAPFSKEDKEELDKSMMEHIQELTGPLYKKYFGSTNPNLKSDTLERFSREEEDKMKLQDDVIKKHTAHYARDPKAADQEMKEWIGTLPREERQRATKRYNKGKRLQGVDYWYIDLHYARNPEVKAREYWTRYKDASSKEKEEMDATIKKVGGIRSGRFRKELKRLEENN